MAEKRKTNLPPRDKVSVTEGKIAMCSKICSRLKEGERWSWLGELGAENGNQMRMRWWHVGEYDVVEVGKWKWGGLMGWVLIGIELLLGDEAVDLD